MIKEFEEAAKVLKYYLEKPCKECLVSPCCSIKTVDCEIFNNYMKWLSRQLNFKGTQEKK